MVVPSQGLVTASAALSAAGRYSMLWCLASGLGAVFSSQRREFLVLIVAITLEWIITNGPVKLLFNRQRPDNSDVVHMHPLWLRAPRSSSFPSGHSAAGGFSTVIWWGWSPITGVICAVAAVLMGLSRIVLRAHHPTDVVAGLLWGATLASFSLLLFGSWLPG